MIFIDPLSKLGEIDYSTFRHGKAIRARVQKPDIENFLFHADAPEQRQI
jgi:hypothetical protein